jgi:hypothetical protein
MEDQTPVVRTDVAEMSVQNSVLLSHRIGTIAGKIQRDRRQQTLSPESALILIKVRLSEMVSASNENNGEMIPQTLSPESALIRIKARVSEMVSASNENNGETIPHRKRTRSAKKLPGTIKVSGQGNQSMPPKNRAREVHGVGFLLRNVKR